MTKTETPEAPEERELSKEELEIQKLIEKQIKISNDRGEAEMKFKAQAQEVQAQIDRLTISMGLDKQLEGLSPEVRKQVLADLAGKGE